MNKIKVSYQTGNSFGSEDCEDEIEYEWESLEYAKESLQRIKNHYSWYSENQHIYSKPTKEMPVGVIWVDEYRCVTLELISDKGETFYYNPCWVGYFETLYCAEIVSKQDSDMIYRP